MKFIEHCTSELICETPASTRLKVGAIFMITEDAEVQNNILVRVREITANEVRVDIVEGDLVNVDEDDRVVTVGFLPRGYYVTRDDDGDWVLVPPKGATIFSVPGEPVLLATMTDSKQDAVTEAAQYLAGVTGEAT